ncbi:hypothetical protein, partial [Saccharopolyspora sp. NPDC003762]
RLLTSANDAPTGHPNWGISESRTDPIQRAPSAAATRHSLAEADALDSRFRLLHDQYTSDLARLDMVGEAGTLLGYFNPGRCVFCGAEPEHQHLNEDCEDDTTAFAESVHAETRKTAVLRYDLVEALDNLDVQRAELRRRLSKFASEAARARAEIRRLDERLTPQRTSLEQLLGTRSELERRLDVHSQIQKLEALKAEVAAEARQEKVTSTANLRRDVLTDLSNAIAVRLRAWGFPDADNTYYDLNEQDIISGDQLRSAHGKGVRAILHAAFTIALAQYCFDREIPHPGFVILDSPLVTYRPPEDGGPLDRDDVLDPSLAGKFYADIQDNFDGQVIIMENTDPPHGLRPGSVDLPFTKNRDHGRYGFFPHGEA